MGTVYTGARRFHLDFFEGGVYMNNTAEFILIMGGVAFATVFINVLINRSIGRKRHISFEKTSPSAEVRSQCMVRESSLEEPGSAQVLDGELWIFTVTDKTLRIPLAQTKLIRIRRKNIFGNIGWFWKTIFYLETPRTCGLRLGVNNPEQWERVLRQSVS
jgi:hypothetical protein